MSNYLNPIDAATVPRENLIRYLLTAYPLRDPHLHYGLKKLLETPGNIFQQAYLEGVQPYRPGNTIAGLIEEGLLHPAIARLFDPHRPLYQHQHKAIRAVVAEEKNIIVATGTGSGKTECFLIPMMDYLLKNRQGGLQALILYPMNAVVNDQVKRLRQLLCHQDDKVHPIRFGFYTSRTPKDDKRAAAELQTELEATDIEELKQLLTGEKQNLNTYRKENLVAEVFKNVKRVQAISREEIWHNPPQILITNYSMLEHMLIRPQERETIFESAKNFKFLIVDEAHSYNGSTGTEVAMLLRRLRAAVGIESQGRLKGIATSASLGDHNVSEQVKDFAGELFGEPFQEVIWGERVTVAQRSGKPYSLPGVPAHESFYNLDLPAVTDSIEQWRDQLRGLVPLEVLEKAESQCCDDVHKFLWFALRQHPIVQNLITILSIAPTPWLEIAKDPQLWSTPDLPADEHKLEVALSHLVQLGSLARLDREDLPLLPVRLHLLFRSMEGVYACINPDCEGRAVDPAHGAHQTRYGKLFLNSQESCDCCGSAVLELASCRKCGQAYALTYVVTDNILQSLPRSLESVENSDSVRLLSSGPLDSITDDGGEEEEEDINDESDFPIAWRGNQPQGWISLTTKNTVAEHQLKPGKLKCHKPSKRSPNNILDRCPACSAGRAQSVAIGRFVSYTDAPLEVILDS
ncbi:MAG: hypothetical protein N5P05_003643 [Chroococcopsis gigantea SAG 12.99]|jgi:hypothetical protein|nr:hypothetical protein [Chroococcopsis gigantea SAG 12.99]